MRYEKSQNLLSLALEMQGSAEGLSLMDIQERFEVSRRTAERMRDAVMALYPQVEEFDAGDGFKRWRIRSKRTITSIPVSAEELVALHNASEKFRRDGMDEQSKLISNVASKFQGLLLPEAIPRLAPDYEVLLQAEGLASRPGPRPNIDAAVLGVLREAIKASAKVKLHYRSRTSGALSRLPVDPYGFLYGDRHYLVAFNPYEEVNDFRLFSLSNIETVETLDEFYVRDQTFDINNYAIKSFGIFQEEPINVIWRVVPEAADDARTFMFHPTQTIDEQPDGSLLIKFTAGGMLEMCWHLFTWGGAVQIVEPAELVKIMREQLKIAKNILPRRPHPQSGGDA